MYSILDLWYDIYWTKSSIIFSHFSHVFMYKLYSYKCVDECIQMRKTTLYKTWNSASMRFVYRVRFISRRDKLSNFFRIYLQLQAYSRLAARERSIKQKMEIRANRGSVSTWLARLGSSCNRWLYRFWVWIICMRLNSKTILEYYPRAALSRVGSFHERFCD